MSVRVDSNIFKAYDVRGLYPDELNEETACAIGAGFIAYLKATRIALGREGFQPAPGLHEPAPGLVSRRAGFRGLLQQIRGLLDQLLEPGFLAGTLCCHCRRRGFAGALTHE